MEHVMKSCVLTLALILSMLVPRAEAIPIIAGLPEFNGAFHDSSELYPKPPVTVGTMFYLIPPGHQIVSAVIGGTFGNSVVNSTAGVDLFLDGIPVGQCLPFASPCWTGPGEPWSHTFTPGELAELADGAATLTAVQTNEFNIRLGETGLLMEAEPAAGVPLPATMFLMVSGIVGLVALRGRLR